jgi:hypothetical protein
VQVGSDTKSGGAIYDQDYFAVCEVARWRKISRLHSLHLDSFGSKSCLLRRASRLDNKQPGGFNLGPLAVKKSCPIPDLLKTAGNVRLVATIVSTLSVDRYRLQTEGYAFGCALIFEQFSRVSQI